MNFRINSEFLDGREFISFISTRRLNSSGVTEVQNHSGLYRMEIYFSLTGLVLLSATKVLIDLVFQLTALPTLGCDLTYSRGLRGLHLHSYRSRVREGMQKQGVCHLSFKEDTRSCPERLPRICTTVQNLVMWPQQGMGFETRVVENKYSFSVCWKIQQFFSLTLFF